MQRERFGKLRNYAFHSGKEEYALFEFRLTILGIHTKKVSVSVSEEEKKKVEEFTAAAWNGQLEICKNFLSQPDFVKLVNQPNKRGLCTALRLGANEV